MKGYIKSFRTSILTVALIVILCGGGNAENIQDMDAQTEIAILAEDWAKVANLLTSVDTETSSPVLRLIKAHAQLASNQNNESLCLFLSTSSEDEINQWQKWSEDFAEQYPQKAIAHYFKGDAFARLRQWDLALETFNQALELHPNHPLILNARGLTYAAKEEYDLASVDFYIATKISHFFADAYANSGSLCIQRSEGAEGALEAFDQALDLSPDFALALNGRAAARIAIGNWKNWKEAENDLEKVGTYSEDCLSVVVEAAQVNLTSLLQNSSEYTAEAFKQVAKIEPGMSYEDRVERIKILPAEEVSRLKGASPGWIAHNSLYSGIAPDETTFDLKVGTDLMITGVGIGIDVGARWDERKHTMDNLAYQIETLEILEKYRPEVNPMEMGSVGEWITGKIYPELSQADIGGVSTEEIDKAHVDKGNWSVVTLYGLLYDMKPKQMSEKAD